MSLHKEVNLETEICDYLGSHGWLYIEGDGANYDRALSLYPNDILEWVQNAYPTAWEAITKNHGAKAKGVLLSRIREEIYARGTLEVLRHGIQMLGLRNELKLAEFKPALAINPDITARYKANRLRVIRQVHYSEQNENSIDLVLFLNGIPVATVELKTDFTQSIDDAIDQYRYDRNPRPKGQAPETLLSFPNGALVHFAVSNSEVAMTTQLIGMATKFLPFNLGDNGGKGNPINPKGGHRTTYLWENVWERESWLEILGRYLITKRKNNKISDITFPRYHQLDATRKLQAAISAEGAGGKYLIQHSAGSGKTKSIAWTAHFLAELHDKDNKKVFDTVVVVSDRNVIDQQLQEELFDFQRTVGVVYTVKGREGNSKSTELAEALSGDKKIVVCTIQTFPFALEAVRELSATSKKRFAVIADEAHSSQTGEAASKLKEVLSAEELKELSDGGEISTEDILAVQMTARAEDKGITFIAFTATPKNKTMEIFGTRPDPTRKIGPDNIPHPFHVYSMRQAIEEGFILDVLKNYTPYKLAFKLANEGKEFNEKEVERNTALKKIMGWVKLHPYNIAQKVHIVVEHYREYVSHLLNGKAKAMVVVGSRLEAVRWQIAINKYIKDQNYQMHTLVAFSGEVHDKESGDESFSETSRTLNPDLNGRQIRDAFDEGDYQILLVANKFQTGFDQPLLCGMYVDKRLAGIQAVQTLSRLNRACNGKDTTYIIDFINDPTDIYEAFKVYYSTVVLSDTTDPNIVYNLKSKLDATGYYDSFEVERVVVAELNPSSKQSDLVRAIEPVQQRIINKYKAAQESLMRSKSKGDDAAVLISQEEIETLVLFKSDLGTYIRLYTFLSQIFDYGNTDVERRFIFFKRLLPLLEFGREREGIDLSKVVLTHHSLKNMGNRTIHLNEGDDTKLDPITDAGGGSVQTREKALLNEIIEKVNNLFSGDLTDGDQLMYVNTLSEKIAESKVLAPQAANNSKERFANSPDFDEELMKAIMDALDAHTSLSTQAINSPTVRAGLKDILLNHTGLYEKLRKSA